MPPEDAVSSTEANEQSGGSVDPAIRTDFETDDKYKLPADPMDDDQLGTNDEDGNDKQTASSTVGREVLNSEAARRCKKQFRRRTDSKIESVAPVEDDFVLMLDSESSGEWMTRVPKERHAVLKDQRLWRIPDNWDHYFRIVKDHGPDEILFQVPESSVYVVILDLESGGAARSGYRVSKIGRLEIIISDMPDKGALQQLLRRIEEEGNDELSAEVIDTLQQLVYRWERFEGKFRGYFQKWGTKRVTAAFRSDDITFDSWSIQPWDQEQKVAHLVDDIFRVERQVAQTVNDVLIEEGVVSPYPTVTLTMKDDRLPEGYRVQALVETGCSPDEAVDYLMKRFHDESRETFEYNREADDSTVRDNVRAARDALSS